MTKDRDDNYFYDGFEMMVLCELVDKIDKNLNMISPKIKEKYHNIDWKVIEKRRHYDELFGPSLKLGETWILASKVLKDELLDNLNKILELRAYYTDYCNKMHEKAMRESHGKKYI